ncbi:MAG TPA: ABC transporter permease subunit [Gemmataceae bacterium]|nr:ABC transporter permease subunit [Gemmataceae bacterium]
MSVMPRTAPARRRRRLRLGLLRRSWRELLGLVCLLTGGWLLWDFGGELSLAQRVGCWVSLALIVAALWRRGWRHLFSAVLFYDLIRSARGGRYALLRCVYAGVILFTLFLLYWSWIVQPAGDPWRLLSGGRIDQKQLAQFTESFFHRFAIVEFVAVLLLTPACTAGALAEEKEKKTLEYLLTSDLYSHEIVVGKLASRLAYLVLVILTGLPFLSLLQLLGGVDPNLVLAAFAVTGLTMLSLASLSILNSLYSSKPRTAIFLTYIETTAYLLVSVVLPWANGWATSHGWLTDWFTGGNIMVAIGRLFFTQTFPGVPISLPPGVVALGTTLGDVLLDYALFHGVVAAVCIIWVAFRFRPYSRKFASRGRRRSFAVTLWRRRLPRIRSEPMRWKELHAEPTFRFNRTGMIVTAIFLWAGLVFILFVFLAAWTAGSYSSDGDAAPAMNSAIRVFGTAVACLLWIGVAVRASTSISGERDRLTLDSLLASPLENDAILRAKWLGSVLCVRRGWWVLAAMWMAGMWTGGLSPLAVPLLIAAWLAFASFAAHVGLWFSLTARSSFRATLWTLIVVLTVGGGYWLLALCCLSPLAAILPQDALEKAATVAYGLTPPGAFVSFAVPSHLRPSMASEVWLEANEVPSRIVAAIAGSAGYLLVGYVLWFRTRRRFARMTGRVPPTSSLPSSPAARTVERGDSILSEADS